MEAWEHSDIVQARMNQPLSPLEKSIRDGMKAEYDARHEEPSKEDSQYLGLEW